MKSKCLGYLATGPQMVLPSHHTFLLPLYKLQTQLLSYSAPLL